MSFLKCCFGVSTTGNGPTGVTSVEASVGPVVAKVVANAVVHKAEPLRTDVAGIGKLSDTSARPGAEPACILSLHELQSSIVAIDEGSFEVRCAQLTHRVQQHFGPAAVVRLFGLAPDGGATRHLVQLAASAATSRAAACGKPGRCFTLHGQRGAVERATSLQADTGDGFADPSEGHLGPASCLLMERALLDQAPAVHRIDRFVSRIEADQLPAGSSGHRAGIRASGPETACERGGPRCPRPPSQPLDCLAETTSLPGPAPLAFAALPLISGRQSLGVLWIVVQGRHEPDGPQTSAPTQGSASRSPPLTAAAKASTVATATTAADSSARGEALLHDAASMSKLALTVSTAMAAASPDQHYIGWLAGTVRHIAECSSVPALVAGVCSAVAQHVRRRFYADVAVQSVLVPEADAHVAFMLYPEAQLLLMPMPPAGGLPGPRSPAVAAQSAGERHGSTIQQSMSVNDGAAHRQQRQHQRVCPPNIPRNAADGLIAERGTRHPYLSAQIQHPVQQQPADSALMPQASGRHVPTALRPFPYPGSVDRDRDSNASGSSSIPLLRAKAYQMSHTLLLRLVALNARSKLLGATPPSAGAPLTHPRAASDPNAAAAAAVRLYGDRVPAGIIVPDTARHVADVRQPSRDVCMLLGPRGMAAQHQQAAAASPGGRTVYSLWASGPSLAAGGYRHFTPQHTDADAHASGSGSTAGGNVGGAGGRSSTASLLLMGMEVADGGCMLGLYISFPSLMPQPLLLAVRDSCGRFLNQVLADLVRDKLQSAELGPDFDTLRAGVPGSYTSMSATQPRSVGRQTERQAAAPELIPLSRSVLQPASPPAGARASVSPDVGLPELSSGGAPEAQSPFVARGKVNGSNAAATASTGTRTTRTTTTTVTNASAHPSNHMYDGLVPVEEFSGYQSAVQMASGPSAFVQYLLESSERTDPGAGSSDPRVGPGSPHHAAVMTVHDLDDTWGMRGIMGTMVEIITTTLQDSAYGMEEVASGNEHPWRATEGLDELSIIKPLGHGANGVVFQGLLGAVPVAIKVMEMSDADLDCSSGSSGRRDRRRSAQGTPSPSPSRSLFQRHEAREVRARQSMMLNATELAVMRTVSHVNIVQVHAVYDNVIMEQPPDKIQPVAKGFSLRRLDAKNPDAGGSPICTAIVLELCDCGSLADVLANRSFPYPGPAPGPASASAPRSASPSYPASQRQGQPCRSQSPLQHSVASQDAVDMRGVYLTLLEIALALRHLHSRRLVHRDLKPANILLKSSPGDPRGWTCKLADFGFALVLNQQDPSAEASAFLESGRSAGPATTGGTARSWYTVQKQACGTVTHMAPEALTADSRIDDSVDIYSFGVVCWELLCGRGSRPFRHLQPAAIPEAVLAGVRPPLPRNLPSAYRKLIISCWAQEPQRRPRAADIVSFIKLQLTLLNGQQR